MSIAFPTSPTAGQIYQNWTWNASAGTWDAVNPGLTLQLRKQIFTASGTYTPSPGLFQADVEVQAGGGGGGGSNGAPSTSGNLWASSGGAAGGYSRRLLTSAQIGGSQAVTVGAAGTAGPNSTASAGAGGNSSFGSLVTANGGAGGAWSQATTGVPLGGAPGIGDIALAGANSPGPAMGNAPTSGVLVTNAGAGANSPFGVGGSGQSYYDATGFGAGHVGSGYGSGGGGACVNPSSGAQLGAAGRPGIVVVTEYCWMTQAAVAAQAASGARVLLMKQTVTAPVASVDFVNVFSALYRDYVLVCTNLRHASAASAGWRYSADGGTTWVATGYANASFEAAWDNTSAAAGGSNTTGVMFAAGAGGIDNTANTAGNFEVKLRNPFSTTGFKYMSYIGNGNITGTLYSIYGAGYLNVAATAYNSVRYLPLTAVNITAGQFELYGIVP